MSICTRITVVLVVTLVTAGAAFAVSYLAFLKARTLVTGAPLSVDILPNASLTDAKDWITQGLVFSGIGAGIFLVSCLALAIGGSRFFARPLKSITEDLERVAKGNFQVSSQLKRSDELGILSRVVEDMAASLKQILIDERNSQSELITTEARFRCFAEASGDWLWETDVTGRLTYFSGELEHPDGPNPQALIGKPLRALFSGDQIDECLERKLDDRRPIRDLLCSLAHRDGRERAVSISAVPYTDQDGSIQGYRGIVRATGATGQQLGAELGTLPDRSEVLKRLEQVLAANQFTKPEVAVLVIGIEELPETRIAHGLGTRKDLLRQIEERLLACTRSADSLGRLKHHTYAIVQTVDGAPEAADARCRRLLTAMRDEPFLMDQEEVPLSINIGCAIPKEALPPAADILRDAEIAMHRAKDSGTDTYRFHDMALSAELATRRQMEGDLSDALAANEIELRYQPMIDATSQMVSGFEATLYWARRGHGPVPKDQLLSLAEASGHGTDLLSALLTTACRDARHWPEMTLVIGLSREQFFNQHLVALVSAALKETGLSPHLLEIEIGEDVLLDDLERALFQLDALREYRVRLGVSGFGARAGSILHLQRCAFDHMKLDKRLFSGANCRPETSSMLLHTIALADVLGTRCDAANVDTQGSADFLVEAGCKRLQGQLFGKPTTSARVLAMLRTHELMSVETQTILPS